jgi:WD40 repeat protein
VAKVEEDGVRPERIAFSPDGRLLAVAWIDSDTFALDAWRVTLWDRQSGETVRTIRTAARGLAFDRAGAQLATVNDNGTAQIWDVRTGDLLVTLSGHTGGLSRSISFSPDGTLVATAGEDKAVRVWDAESGRQRLVLWGHASVVARAVFSPDGTMLASTGADAVVRVWALNLDDLVRIARDNLTRGLTEDECRQFLHADGCAGS